jgi:hypothetical protein
MFDQSPYLEGLGEEADSPGIQCLCADAFVMERRDENERNLASLDLQVSLEFNPAHPGHFYVCDQAGAVT